jgi:hypothetical protein
MFGMGDRECDEAAASVHGRAKVKCLDRPLDPLALCHAAKIRLSCIVPRGCVGALRTDPLELRFVSTGRPRVDNEVLIHEIGHLGAQDTGHRYPQHEPSVDRVGGRVVLPTPAMRIAVREAHWVVPTLLQRLPDYPPVTVLARAAEADQGVCVVHLRGRRWVFAPDTFQLGDALPFERELVASARATQTASGDVLGILAWPFFDGAAAGVAILVPHRTVDRMMRLLPAG